MRLMLAMETAETVVAGTVAAGTVAAGTVAAGTVAAGTVAAGTVGAARWVARAEPAAVTGRAAEKVTATV
jgi:hypothetical protein